MQIFTASETCEDLFLLCCQRKSCHASSVKLLLPWERALRHVAKFWIGPAQVIFKHSDHTTVLNHKNLSMLMKTSPTSYGMSSNCRTKASFTLNTHREMKYLAFTQHLIQRSIVVASAGHWVLKTLSTK